jgi:hypothetical protein
MLGNVRPVSWPVIVGVVASLTGIVGAIAGLGSYALYESELIGADTGANLILVSVLCSLIAIPMGLVGSRGAKKHGKEPVLAQAALALGVGTLAVWFVVPVYALGR